MKIKKGSKNAIENRGSAHKDERGDAVVIFVNGKKTTAFEREGHYYDKVGQLLNI